MRKILLGSLLMVTLIIIICFSLGEHTESKDSEPKVHFNVELSSFADHFLNIYGIVNEEILYEKLVANGIEFIRYNTITQEKNVIGKTSNMVYNYPIQIVKDRVYLWQSCNEGNKQYNLLEINLGNNRVSKIFTVTSNDKPVLSYSSLQCFDEKLFFIISSEIESKLVMYDTNTGVNQVVLKYDLVREDSSKEHIRAIDVEKDRIHVLLEKKDENKIKSYWVDSYNTDMSLITSMEITKIHGSFLWNEDSSEFEYTNGNLLHANADDKYGAGDVFFGNVQNETVDTVIKSIEYKEGVFVQTGGYQSVAELQECDKYKLGYSSSGNVIYRLDLSKGSLEYTVVDEKMGQLVYIIRSSENEILLLLYDKDENGNIVERCCSAYLDEMSFTTTSWNSDELGNYR